MTRPPSRWWRAYDAALENPKVQRLNDRLFRTWFNVLCIACRHDGKLPALADVAFLLRLKPNEAKNRVEELRVAGLLDEIDGHLKPHDWDTMQFKSDVSTERVKRFRSGQSNILANVPNRFRGTVPETETETENKIRSLRKKHASGEPVKLSDELVTKLRGSP